MLKNKLFIGVLALAFVFVVGVSTASAYSTLKLGSSGPDVVTLQTKLAINADGKFGPMTKAAVMAWQASHQLVADGVVGPATWAALMATAPTLPAGCQAGWVVNPITGASCTAPTLPAGCQAGWLVNPMTGASCTGGATTPATGGPLTGDAGEIYVDQSTTSVESEITEGKSDTKVLSFKVEADSSDVEVKSVKLAFTEDSIDANSTRMDRYMDKVTVWMGTTEVGSADVSAFSKNDGVYTKSITLSNAVVREGSSKKATFYVTVDATDSISSDDTDAEWNVEVYSLRFQDATGVIMTYDTTDGEVVETFTVESATANDELKLLSSTNNPTSSNLKVEDQDTSDEYMVFAFKLKVPTDSSDVNVLELPIILEGGPASVEDIIDDIYLKVGSDTFDNVDVTDGVALFTLDEGDLTIEAGDTVEVKVYASFVEMDIDGSYNYPAGQTVKFSVNGTAEPLLVENLDGDSVDSPTNTVTGNEHTLQLQAVNFKLLTPTIVNSSESASVDPYVTITMPLQITTDEALYIYKEDIEDDSVDASLDVPVDYSYSFVSGSNLPDVVEYSGNDWYVIEDTSTLYIKFIINGDIEGDVDSITAQLESVWATDELGVATTEYDLAPASSFDANATLRYSLP